MCKNHGAVKSLCMPFKFSSMMDSCVLEVSLRICASCLNHVQVNLVYDLFCVGDTGVLTEVRALHELVSSPT